MFSRMVALLSQDICGMYDIFTFVLTLPETLWIYPRIADKRVDLPEPTLPTIETNYPRLIFKLSTTKS